MSRYLRILWLPVALLLVTGSVSMASAETTLERIQARHQLILGTSGNMPSMSEVDANGKVVGFDIDIARLMASLMEVELVTEVVPFNELLPALESGKVDIVMSNLTITQKRNLRVAFVGPYMTSGKCFVTKNETLAKAEQSPDLNAPATRLAVLKGSTSEDVVMQLFPKATIVPVENYSDATEMVKTDEITGLLTDYPICLAAIKDNPDAGFVSLLSLLTYEPIGIALPANDAQFINWTQNFLRRLDGTDTLRGLSERWFGKVMLAQ